jgi:methyl-accepting chemotaxis protein
MTDRIRAISAEAHELTRKTRTGLDAIGDEVRQGNKRTNQVADAARRAVEVAQSEIGTLNAATIEQTRQIELALQRINDLSVEIQKDINQIIVAMQFQDITRQKLERLHKPALAASVESLSMLSHETRALLQRDLYRAVRAYAESAVKPRVAGREGSEHAAEGLDAIGAGREDAAPAAEKKVELF